MSSFFRFAIHGSTGTGAGATMRRLAPAMAAAAVTATMALSQSNQDANSHCEAVPDQKKETMTTDSQPKVKPELIVKKPTKENSGPNIGSFKTTTITTKPNATTKLERKELKKAGFQPDAEGYFYDMVPNSQLFQPKLPWPMWDANWDDREPIPTGNDKLDRRKRRYLRKHGVTRHIILVRHGQYDEANKEDEKRILTEMGRKQAEETGKRIAKMIQGIEGDPKSPCNVKVVRVSNLARAKETADIIASFIPQVERSEPDEILNEGRPAHTLPSGGNFSESTLQKCEEQHLRIEAAFQKHFHRADEIDYPPDNEFLDNDGKDVTPPEDDSVAARHEYEIVVCHANVIRYFFCRALQLPPEAWLRLCTFNCSLTYMTIRPTGGVSCRMLGDIGHLPEELVSFSGHHGYNW